jgi:hypothetical protein
MTEDLPPFYTHFASLLRVKTNVLDLFEAKEALKLPSVVKEITGNFSARRRSEPQQLIESLAQNQPSRSSI